MRSYYAYTYSCSNEFISVNVQVASFVGIEAEELAEMLVEATRKEIKRLGYVIPKHAFFRFRPDPRNCMTVEEWNAGRSDGSTPPAAGHYTVESVYEHGITPRH